MFRTKTKSVINTFLCQVATTTTTALVIDAENLASSRALLAVGVPASSITVLNYEEDVCSKARRLGLTAIAGISTDSLRTLHGTFDIIYLDYCGFPVRRADGFDPAFDLLWAADHLRANGVVLATFSRRAQNCAALAEAMIPRSLSLAKVHAYCETSAMMCMFLTSANAREMRTKINALLLAPVAVSPAESVKTNKRKRSARTFYGQPHKRRLTEGLTEGQKVQVKWEGQLFPGIIDSVKAGKYDVFFPKTNEIALMERSQIIKE